MIRNIISITSACLTLTASYFLIKDILKLSPSIIINICSTKKRSGDKNIIELSRQNSNTKVGFFLLILSFSCQLFVLSSFPKIEQMGPLQIKEIILSIVISLILFILSLYMSKYLHEKTMENINNSKEA